MRYKPSKRGVSKRKCNKSDKLLTARKSSPSSMKRASKNWMPSKLPLAKAKSCNANAKNCRTNSNHKRRNLITLKERSARRRFLSSISISPNSGNNRRNLALKMRLLNAIMPSVSKSVCAACIPIVTLSWRL